MPPFIPDHKVLARARESIYAFMRVYAPYYVHKSIYVFWYVVFVVYVEIPYGAWLFPTTTSTFTPLETVSYFLYVVFVVFEVIVVYMVFASGFVVTGRTS